jgi:hypothetical protein
VIVRAGSLWAVLIESSRAILVHVATMPRCEGRPGGPCPLKKNDKSVHLSQGDLMLCAACENFRFPSTHTADKAQSAVPSVERPPTEPKEDKDDGQSVSASAVPNTIIDELLTCAIFYRDKCTSADLGKLIVHFYLPVEISDSKAKLLREFATYVSGCPHAVARRQTSTRSAHEAEVDDILGILESLDNLDVLKLVQFAAISMDRLPKYGPNEINVCSIVDRQQLIDQEVAEIKGSLHEMADFDRNSSAQLAQQTASLATQITTLHQQMVKLAETCDRIVPLTDLLRRSDAAPSPADPATWPKLTLHTAINTRSSSGGSADIRSVGRNVIITGVAESRNASVWGDTVSKALHTAAGRDIKFDDAFRSRKICS